nr:MAG TPA: hypothetical protein [Microviridae sp.]
MFVFKNDCSGSDARLFLIKMIIRGVRNACF